MDLRLTRGAAVALVLLIVGSGGATGQSPVVPARPKDTGTVRIVLAAPRITVDSVAALLRAFEQEPMGSPAFADMREKLERVMKELARGSGNFIFSAPSGLALKAATIQKGWIGINAPLLGMQSVTPSGFFVDYYDYQPIVSVDPESPAQRAGILPGDILVAYNGVDLRGHRFNLTQMLAPDARVTVSVRRDGEIKEFPLVVAKAPQQVFMRRRDLDAPPEAGAQLRFDVIRAGGDGFGPVPVPGGMIVKAFGGEAGRPGAVYSVVPQGVFGARIISVSPELAKKFHIEAGLVVDEVSEESPGYRSGLRTGDVITSVSGQSVTTVRKLLDALAAHDAERSAVLGIIRDSKAKKLTVNW